MGKRGDLCGYLAVVFDARFRAQLAVAVLAFLSVAFVVVLCWAWATSGAVAAVGFAVSAILRALTVPKRPAGAVYG